MIRCIAIDDEPLALRQITSYISQIPTLELVATFRSAVMAKEWLQTNSVELMFVDINMPDMTGVEFVQSLDKQAMVIFTTAYAEYAIDGYKLEAIDYLLKPFGLKDIMRAAEKAVSLYELWQLREHKSAESDESEHHRENGHGLDDAEGCEIVREALVGFGLGIARGSAGAPLEQSRKTDGQTGEDAGEQDGDAGAADGSDLAEHDEHENHSVERLGDGSADKGKEKERRGLVGRIALLPRSNGRSRSETGSQRRADRAQTQAGDSPGDNHICIHFVTPLFSCMV